MMLEHAPLPFSSPARSTLFNILIAAHNFRPISHSKDCEPTLAACLLSLVR